MLRDEKGLLCGGCTMPKEGRETACVDGVQEVASDGEEDRGEG